MTPGDDHNGSGEAPLAGYLDFNEPRKPFQFLGKEAGSALQDAASFLAFRPGTKRSHAAALRAVRLALTYLAARAEPVDEARTALAAVAAATHAVEAALRESSDGATPAFFKQAEQRGRPRASDADLSFQGRAVLAVNWLQRLKDKPYARDSAFSAVARAIPSRMLTQYDNQKRSQTEQLAAWMDSFGRKRDKEHQYILNDLRFEIWEAWCRSWRPIVGAASDGTPIYGEIIDDDESNATPDTVLAWLTASIAAH